MERRLLSPLHQNCYYKGILNLLQASNVLAQNVELDIDNRTYTNVAEVGVLECVGNDGNLERV